jgi:hypothetical protein
VSVKPTSMARLLLSSRIFSVALLMADRPHGRTPLLAAWLQKVVDAGLAVLPVNSGRGLQRRLAGSTQQTWAWPPHSNHGVVQQVSGFRDPEPDDDGSGAKATPAKRLWKRALRWAGALRPSGVSMGLEVLASRCHSLRPRQAFAVVLMAFILARRQRGGGVAGCVAGERTAGGDSPPAA